MRAHAYLSASSAHRWLACTRAPSLESEFPDEDSSVYAEEGTDAHTLAEAKVNERTGHPRGEVAADKVRRGKYFNAEMDRCTDAFADYVLERYHEAKAQDRATNLFTEERVDFSEVVPKGFGTADVIIVNDEKLVIIDLKYGKGVKVDAVENPQLRLYAIGALDATSMIHSPKRVEMVIVQPRLDSISVDEMTVADLMQWGETYVKPRASLAIAGDGDFAPGDACKFCKARGACKARAEYMYEINKHAFQSPELMEPSELAEVLMTKGELSAWLKDVEEYAHTQLMKGEDVPGWKLVEGQRRRKITNEDEVLAALRRKRYRLDDIAPRKLLTIGKLEKLVGKDELATIAGTWIELPAGAPVLAPMTDKRPAWSRADELISNFTEV